MNFHQLRIFNSVAKHNHLPKAAAELGLSQQTITVHLQNLEQDLEVQLLHRVGRTVHLTQAGHILFQYTEKVFTLTEEAEQVLRRYRGYSAEDEAQAFC